LPLQFNWRVELHPVLAHFPIALLFLAFLLDGIGWVWKSQAPRIAAFYCLVAGAIGTVLTVISGLLTPEAREREGGALQGAPLSLRTFFSGRLVEVHKHWGYVLLALVVLWLAARVLAQVRPPRWRGLAMSISVLVMIALIMTGYYGGDLVYGRRGRGRGQMVPSPRVEGSHVLSLEGDRSPTDFP
jgi:uncharacterized membrane protein